MPGVKPSKGPSFVKVRFPNYDIDDQIKSIMTTGSKGQLAARKDSARSLKECVSLNAFLSDQYLEWRELVCSCDHHAIISEAL